jgi:hypothetical protein
MSTQNAWEKSEIIRARVWEDEQIRLSRHWENKQIALSAKWELSQTALNMSKRPATCITQIIDREESVEIEAVNDESLPTAIIRARTHPSRTKNIRPVRFNKYR